jgi:hypothetical protein
VTDGQSVRQAASDGWSSSADFLGTTVTFGTAPCRYHRTNPYRFPETGTAMIATANQRPEFSSSSRGPTTCGKAARRLALRTLLVVTAGFGTAVAGAGEYVISDDTPTPQPARLSAEQRQPAAGRPAETVRPAPEPDGTAVAVEENHEDNHQDNRLTFEGFLGDVSQAALLRPLRAKVISDEPVVVSDEPVASEWSFSDDEPLAYQPAEPAAVLAEECGPTCCPKWTLQADALFLWQNNIASRPLFIDNTTTATVLDANDIRPTVGIGPRLALLRHFDTCNAFEANYFIVQSLRGDANLPLTSPPAYEQADINGFIYNDIDSVAVVTDSQIQSAELNWRRRKGFATFLAGFRYVEWMSAMQINDTFTTTTGTPFSGNDSFLTETGNELYGGQLGCDLVLWNRGQSIRVNGLGKAGVYYNQAFQRTTIETTAPAGSPGFTPINATETQSMQQTSFFGEVGANATLDLTSWLSWRVGYSLFWLSGVATPAEQLSVVMLDPGTGGTDANGINTSGSVLLHGVTTGVEARW